MRDATSASVPKWPFFLGDAVLLALAWFVFSAGQSPFGHWAMIACVACVALGATFGVWPFLLEHRARLKQFEVEALGSVGEKLQNLERLAAQISSATNEWQNVHLQAEKTSIATKEITDRIIAEVRDFNAFMQKANDSERANLRLELEKMRRAEFDWLQALVLVLDHVNALHAGAVRSGKTGIIEQLSQFRAACLDAGRRVGLVAYVPAPGDAFDPARHQSAEGGDAPANAVVGEVLTAGFTLQGRVVRPAIVRAATRDSTVAVPSELRDSEVQPPPDPAQSQLTLDASQPG